MTSPKRIPPAGRNSPARRLAIALAVLTPLLLATALAGLCLGVEAYSPVRVAALLAGSDPDPVARAVVLGLRLPRVLLAMLAGGTLSTAGLVFQALLRNPLAEPYILGISGGAAIGAIGGLLLGLGGLAGPVPAAFAGGLLTLLAVLGVGSRLRAGGRTALLLTGVMVNAFCGAVILFLVTMIPHTAMGSVVYWLMGGLSYNDAADVGMLAAVSLPCLMGIGLLAHGMNLLQLGEDSARTTGLRVTALRRTLLWLTTIMVSACVAVCGPLGFIGLVVPHALRGLLGADHRVLVPGSILAGGAFLTACDLLARVVPTQGELPVGVVTAMIGAPCFILLLVRRSA